MNVFVLWHAHDLEEEVDVKLLGVYSSEQNAQEAKQRASTKPGFADAPDGFQIGCYELDKDEWTDGFATTGR
jgi:homoserine kinase type II